MGNLRINKDDSLMGRWMLDATDGLRDVSNHGNDGTGMGGITIGTSQNHRGRTNGATNFVGASNQYVDCGNGISLRITTQITMTIWIKPTTLTAEMPIISKWTQPGNQRAYYFGTHWAQFDEIYAYFSKDGGAVNWYGVKSTNAAMIAGNWYFIVVTYDGTTLNFYRNATLLTTSIEAGTPGVIFDSSANLQIGQFNAGTFVTPFNGLSGDPRIYNRVLSASEVQQLYLQDAISKIVM